MGWCVPVDCTHASLIHTRAADGPPAKSDRYVGHALVTPPGCAPGRSRVCRVSIWYPGPEAHAPASEARVPRGLDPGGLLQCTAAGLAGMVDASYRRWGLLRISFRQRWAKWPWACAMGAVVDCQKVETVRKARLHLATASNSQACGIKLGLTHLWSGVGRCTQMPWRSFFG